MKLHTKNRSADMGEGHDFALAALRGRAQAIGQLFDNQRMITTRLHGPGQTGKQAVAIMVNGRGFAMHGFARPPDPAAIGLCQGLMAETHAQYRHIGRAGGQQLKADAGFIRRAGAGRKISAFG